MPEVACNAQRCAEEGHVLQVSWDDLATKVDLLEAGDGRQEKGLSDWRINCVYALAHSILTADWYFSACFQLWSFVFNFYCLRVKFSSWSTRRTFQVAFWQCWNVKYLTQTHTVLSLPRRGEGREESHQADPLFDLDLQRFEAVQPRNVDVEPLIALRACVRGNRGHPPAKSWVLYSIIVWFWVEFS